KERKAICGHGLFELAGGGLCGLKVFVLRAKPENFSFIIVPGRSAGEKFWDEKRKIGRIDLAFPLGIDYTYPILEEIPYFA
ncbi:MAG: hypothetical protein PHQ75_09325, partial [Thermoguttaceae bacterium]|nr:hypothetical protein [Thermoguttaceae bacterium]